MVLTGEFADPIESIDCEASGTRVVGLDEVSGAQEMTTSGMMLQLTPGYYPNMPAHCPLTMQMIDRELGNFAVCATSCQYALLDHEEV